ncbi:hypothetical protein [Streptomyces sp. NPDC003395]
MTAADATPYHYVIHVTITGHNGRATGGMTRDGIVHWRTGETRQDQYHKVLAQVNASLAQDGFTNGFATQFWTLEPNHR